MNSIQYQDFLKIENFNLAFIRLKTAPYTLYKSIYIEDLKVFEVFLESNLKTIIDLIETNKYEPNSCNKILTPKNELQVRPVYMLCFVDLLVFQALINVIGDKAFDKLSPNYNLTIFGNQINSTKDKRESFFQYKSWKSSYNAFSKLSRKVYNAGFEYLLEFDITSFFDTIDQDILLAMLSEEYDICDELLKILEKCLKIWTVDSNHKSYSGKRGIPQGPNCSACLAEIYLAYVDTEIKSKTSLEIKYLRYVDDIRIFSKNELTLKKAAVYLEICTRDIGLISQSSKLQIKKISDINMELKSQFNKFSKIGNEYHSIHENKPKKHLTLETHNKLKVELLNCFKEDAPEDIKLNKTIISFSIFKLNKDEEIKNILVENYSKIIPHFEKVLYYLSVHFRKDKEVLSFIKGICYDADILFKHLIALCLKYFPNIQLDDKFIKDQFNEKSRHWLPKYYLIDWLLLNNRFDILESSFNSNESEYYNAAKLYYIIDSKKQNNGEYKAFLLDSMKSKNPIIAIYASRNWFLFDFGKIENQYLNAFAANILKFDSIDFAKETLKHNIRKIDAFFDSTIFSAHEIHEILFYYSKYLLNISFDKKVALENILNFIRVSIDKFCIFAKNSHSAAEIIKSILAHNTIPFSEDKNIVEKTEKIILKMDLILCSGEDQLHYYEKKKLDDSLNNFIRSLASYYNLKLNYTVFFGFI